MPYTKISEAKKDGFPTKAEGISMTIEQINKLASIYDALKKEAKVENPMSVAWTTWKKIYKKVADKWVKIEKKQASYRICDCRLEFNEKVPDEIQLIPTGKWDHAKYGKMEITEEDITEFKENFDAGIRKGVPITAGHDDIIETEAVGWIKEVVDKGIQGLFAIIEWTKQGKTLLENKSFKYFSPEYYEVYEDPETRKKYTNVLSGGALTNSPYFKGLKAIVFSDKDLINLNDNTMEIKEVLQKEISDLTDEEKKFIVDNKDELSDDDKVKYADVLEVKETETETEGDTETETEGGTEETTETEGETEETTETEKVEASDKNVIKITAGEYSSLQAKADQGAKAFAELTKTNVGLEVGKLIFTEQNSNGKILPKNREKVFSFMMELSKKQRKEFTDIIDSIETKDIFSEKGSSDKTIAGTASAELETKIGERMTEKKMTYSDALKEVFSENSELVKGYNSEVTQD